jgi:PilZ domain-containing protein
MKGSYKKSRNIDDRRFNNRVFVEMDVTTYIDDEKYDTKMRNISGNGMQIVEPANIDITPNQLCQILIQDEGNTIKLDASVVWKDFGLIGLCFKKQNQKIQKQINKLSQRLLMDSISDKGMTGLA